jgi:hypothetical protein
LAKKTWLLIFILGCATRPGPQDVELKPYLDQFVSDGAKRGVTLDPSTIGLSFVDSYQVSTMIGQCSGTTKMGNITILRGYWERAHPIERMSIMYHELGHCLLKLDHVEGPTNLMSPMALYYWEFEPEMVDQMFDWYKHGKHSLFKRYNETTYYEVKDRCNH